MNKFVSAIALLALSFSINPALAGQAKFVSEKFGYEVEIPKSWNVDVSESGVPVFFNYPRTEAGPQGLFPDGGANIFLVPLAAVEMVVKATDVDSWIARSMLRDHNNVVVRHISNVGNQSLGAVVKVEADFARDPQDDTPQHEVSYYFILNGEMYHMMMLYWKGDRKTTYFRSLATEMLRSVRHR